ncbi:hypothetical protein FPOAC1_003754 [Fusarium poae]|uniref:hypothetical protein n=1 Tax=Fusarium poae TaxID=36050 RepID=UPI001CEB1816|nr:hypothetical protein FPOAC1_003754 [Fusarium poae]KAG8677726.1 hypothetical protein FPOAC1_003754 [Fusarium poae]
MPPDPEKSKRLHADSDTSGAYGSVDPSVTEDDQRVMQHVLTRIHRFFLQKYCGIIAILTSVVMIMIMIFLYAACPDATVNGVQDAKYSFCRRAIESSRFLGRPTQPSTQIMAVRGMRYTFPYVDDWGPALDDALGHIGSMSQVAEYTDYDLFPTLSQVRRLKHINLHLDQKFPPVLAQARLDLQSLVSETKENPVSRVCFDTDLIEPWWQFGISSCKSRLEQDFKTLLEILPTAQDSSLIEFSREGRKILNKLSSDSCTKAVHYQHHLRRYVSRFSLQEGRGVDSHLTQLNLVSETMDFF